MIIEHFFPENTKFGQDNTRSFRAEDEMFNW